MKKIGLTLTDEDYKVIVAFAEKNDTTPTTLCRLIIETRINFYLENNYEPIFRKQFFEKLSPEGIDELVRIAKTPWLEK